MILAAGMSSRMKKSSTEKLESTQTNQANTRPKCMIEVGKNKRPFLLYLLSNAQKAGCDQICLILNENDMFTEAYLRQNPPKGLSISFVFQEIPTGREKPLGTADAVLQGLNGCPEWGKSSFMVCNSDNLYSVMAFKLLLNSTSLNAMINYDFFELGVEADRVFAFSVIQEDNGRLIRIIEKPTDDQVQSATEDDGRIGVSMNLFKLNTMDVKIFLQNCPLHPTRNEKELPTAIQSMISEGSISLETIPLSEMVLDLTSKSDITQIEPFLD